MPEYKTEALAECSDLVCKRHLQGGECVGYILQHFSDTSLEYRRRQAGMTSRTSTRVAKIRKDDRVAVDRERQGLERFYLSMAAPGEDPLGIDSDRPPWRSLVDSSEERWQVFVAFDQKFTCDVAGYASNHPA